MRYAIAFLLTLCSLCIFEINAQPLNYQFSRIDIKKGLSHNQVNAILKDRKGFVWFGTMSGLNRYDGYKFRVFRNNAADENSISDNYIEKIIEGPDEKIWVVTRKRHGYAAMQSSVKLIIINNRLKKDETIMSLFNIVI